ncbi:MAG: hypothetical protein KDC32_26020, partial [Saprospiraceae bacterium]|nr:hypothetical protein [Saprospiraceae bacterium]
GLPRLSLQSRDGFKAAAALPFLPSFNKKKLIYRTQIRMFPNCGLPEAPEAPNAPKKTGHPRCPITEFV